MPVSAQRDTAKKTSYSLAKPHRNAIGHGSTYIPIYLINCDGGLEKDHHHDGTLSSGSARTKCKKKKKLPHHLFFFFWRSCLSNGSFRQKFTPCSGKSSSMLILIKITHWSSWGCNGRPDNCRILGMHFPFHFFSSQILKCLIILVLDLKTGTQYGDEKKTSHRCYAILIFCTSLG